MRNKGTGTFKKSTASSVIANAPLQTAATTASEGEEARKTQSKCNVQGEKYFPLPPNP
jgi:hypothetical protein